MRLSVEQVKVVWTDIERERRASVYLHQPPMLVEGEARFKLTVAAEYRSSKPCNVLAKVSSGSRANCKQMLPVDVPALGNKPVKFPLAGNAVGEARPLQPSDIPGVAQLFQKTFRNAREPAPAALLDYLDEIFLNHPWQDGEQVSKVIVDREGASQASSACCRSGCWSARPLFVPPCSAR